MIISQNISNLNPIIFSVLMIFYLILMEFGDKKIKRALLPLVIILMAVFAIVVVLSGIGE